MPIYYKNYPPDWLKIRKRILLRANNKCEFCGLENYSFVFAIPVKIKDEKGNYKQVSLWFNNIEDINRNFPEQRDIIKMVRVILTVAHLDHDETNHKVKDERLKALCQMCHLKYDAKEKYERIKRKWKKSC